MLCLIKHKARSNKEIFMCLSYIQVYQKNNVVSVVSSLNVMFIWSSLLVPEVLKVTRVYFVLSLLHTLLPEVLYKTVTITFRV